MSSEQNTGRVGISVVTPVYRCSECIMEFWRRTSAALNETGETWEIIFVDDRSPDDSWSVLQALTAREAGARAVRLSRNFGQQCAITAGLAASNGDHVVVIDCDLEDPPEEIPRMLRQSRETGAEIILAKRTGRKTTWFRRQCAKAYARLLTRLTEHDIDPAYGSYTLISRRVCQQMLRFTDRDRHYLHLLFWLGFERSTIEITQDERFAGESSYNFPKLVAHAISGLMFHTTVALRWIIYLGFAATLGGVTMAAVLIANRLANNVAPGWTSLAVLILMIGGMTIACLGVIGLYIGRIFEEVRARPLFVVDEERGGQLAHVDMALPRESRTMITTRN